MKFRRFLAILGIVLVSWGGVVFSQTQPWITRQGRAKVFNALVGVFEDHYWDPAYRDWQAWAARYRDSALDAGSRVTFDNIIRRMVGELGDDHSSWLGIVNHPVGDEAPPALTPQLGFRQGFLPGVGMVIERSYQGTPAGDAGLRRGDIIEQVNGEDVRRLGTPYQANEVMVRAVGAGGDVSLKLKRGLERFSVSLQPEAFARAEVEDRPQGEMLDATTGYLYLPSFSEGVAGEFHRLLAELQARGAESLVLDLRGNLGGRLGELGLVLGAFIEGSWADAVSRGELVWRGRYDHEREFGVNVLEEPDGDVLSLDRVAAPTFFTGPLAVLVDRDNSSAGEIAPLVLQDFGRAAVIGEPTLGNVEAIQGFELPDGSLVMVAVANLQGVDGQDFSQGVTPDVLAVEDLAGLARGFDAPLAEALRYLKNLPFTPGKFF